MSRRIFDTAFGLYRAEMAVREGEGTFLRTVSDEPQINYLPVTWGRYDGRQGEDAVPIRNWPLNVCPE